MDTLISIGTLSALAWSLYALFLGEAGLPGMTMALQWTLRRGSGAHEIYLEVATAVTRPRWDDPDAVTVEPVEVAELVHTFAADESVLIGCHQPGHYDAGMVLAVTAR